MLRGFEIETCLLACMPHHSLHALCGGVLGRLVHWCRGGCDGGGGGGRRRRR
eukprot:COSAG05_NODE_5772_length_1091_cov_1.252016_3_plen_51_part_01